MIRWGSGGGGGGEKGVKGRDRAERGDGRELRDGGKCGEKGRDRSDRKRSDGGGVGVRKRAGFLGCKQRGG